MKLGIVGLPNVGKSTLFNAITKAGAQAANYPFCTIEPNTGIVAVPDKRLEVLSEMFSPKKTTPASVEFVDIAGLVKGASRGEGLGNKFLSHIREVDAIVHVVRCFEDDNIIHVDGNINPARDIEIISLELVFADLDTVQRRTDKAQKLCKNGDKKMAVEAELGKRLLVHLEEGKPARSFTMTSDEQEIISGWFLLTDKPVLYAANIADSDIGHASDNPHVAKVVDIALREKAQVFTVSAQVEEEIATMDAEEKQEFLEDLGLSESGLDKLIRASYKLLGLISYITSGEIETRAWTIKQGTKAPGAAGKIHSDFERGFIKAEVVAYKDLIQYGTMTAAKEKGLVRIEGKEYTVQDGDVILFRFNV